MKRQDVIPMVIFEVSRAMDSVGGTESKALSDFIGHEQDYLSEVYKSQAENPGSKELTEELTEGEETAFRAFLGHLERENNRPTKEG